jgi:hypothetical protein
VYIDGLITDETIAAGTLAGKQTNEALRLYTGATDFLLSESPLAPLVNANNIWIPTDTQTGTPIKWKAYVGDNGEPNLTADPAGFLIWDGGTGTPTPLYPNRIITYELTKITITDGIAVVDNVQASYIIDYSGVTFVDPVAEASKLAADLGGQESGVTATGTVVTVTGTAASIAAETHVTVPDGVTLTVSSGATLNVAGELNVAGNATVEGKITVASGGKIVSPALGADGLPGDNAISFGDNGTVELAQGAIGYYGDVAFIGPAPAAGAENPYAYNWGTATDGKVTLKDDNVTELTSGSVTAAKSTAIPPDTTITVASGATLTVAADTTFVVAAGGTLEVEGTFTNEGTVILEAAEADNLNESIALRKVLDGNGNFVVGLTPAFYTTAAEANAPIVADPGTTRNTKPYIIQGQGIEDSDPELEAGVLLANDQVTLKDVKLVAGATSAVLPKSPWTATASYKVGISVGRYGDDVTTRLTGLDGVSKGITIENCVIVIDASDNTDTTNPFTAGILLSGGGGNVSGSDIAYVPKNVTINNNTITVTGNAGFATAGILIGSYDYSIKITNNTIDAKYGTAQTGLRNGAPASALFFNRVLGESLIGTGDPEISGNTLVLDTTSNQYAYSFFINAYQTYDATTINSHVGVDALRGNNFALANTTWALSTATDTGSSYKKLFNALLANIGTGTGFAYVSVPYSSSAYELEQYNIQDGKVTRISVLGDHLTDGKYVGTDNQNNVFNSSGGGTPKGVDYGSFAVENGAVSGEKDGHFYFTYSNVDTDYDFEN